MKLSKRDIKFFFAGAFTFIIISFVWDLENNIQDMKEGYNAGYNDARNLESNE